MDNFLIDKATLERFIDELFAKVQLTGKTDAEVAALREQKIHELDDKIGMAIFGALNKDQLADVNKLMDLVDDEPDTFRDFFKNAGVDVSAKMETAMKEFADEFLGGYNG